LSLEPLCRPLPWAALLGSDFPVVLLNYFVHEVGVSETRSVGRVKKKVVFLEPVADGQIAYIWL
jgi:hypothetical protein